MGTQPRPGFVDLDDEQVWPDLGLDIPLTGVRAVPCGPAGSYTVFMDVKAQASGGSAKEKIEHTIRSYAALSDETGAVCHLLHLMCPAAVGDGFLHLMAELAEQACVGFMDIHGLDRNLLVSETRRLHSKRRRLPDEDYLRDVLAQHGPEVLAAACRLGARDRIDGHESPTANDPLGLFSPSWT